VSRKAGDGCASLACPCAVGGRTQTWDATRRASGRHFAAARPSPASPRAGSIRQTVRPAF